MKRTPCTLTFALPGVHPLPAGVAGVGGGQSLANGESFADRSERLLASAHRHRLVTDLEVGAGKVALPTRVPGSAVGNLSIMASALRDASSRYRLSCRLSSSISSLSRGLSPTSLSIFRIACST